MSVAPVSLKHCHRLNASRNNLDGTAHTSVCGFLSGCVLQSFSFLYSGSCRDQHYFCNASNCLEAFTVRTYPRQLGVFACVFVCLCSRSCLFSCAPWRFSPAVMTQAQNRLAHSARELRHRDEASHPQSADVSERVVVTKSVMSVPVISSPWYDPRRTRGATWLRRHWSHLLHTVTNSDS